MHDLDALADVHDLARAFYFGDYVRIFARAGKPDAVIVASDYFRKLHCSAHQGWKLRFV
jgi:hypothetical protein